MPPEFIRRETRNGTAPRQRRPIKESDDGRTLIVCRSPQEVQSGRQEVKATAAIESALTLLYGLIAEGGLSNAQDGNVVLRVPTSTSSTLLSALRRRGDAGRGDHRADLGRARSDCV